MSVTQRDVLEDEAEIRLDRWFRRHFPHLTQGAISKLCRTGQIRVDGKRIEPSTHLQPGQIVRIPPLPEGPAPAPPPAPPDVAVVRDMKAMVIYQDDSIVVLNKPAGLAVQGGPGIKRHIDGMLDALRGPDAPRPRLVHRLDQETSGLLLLARTPGVAAKLAAAFRGRDVQKTYWAITKGRPTPQSGRITLPLVRFGGLRGERTAVAEPDEEGATSAVTDYRTLNYASRKLAWLELHPLTGRTHQLRVHCKALGTPILSDSKYGGENAGFEGLPNRLHLHARAITLPHPSGGTLTLEAELPEHMRETFDTIGFIAQPPRPPERG